MAAWSRLWVIYSSHVFNKWDTRTGTHAQARVTNGSAYFIPLHFKLWVKAMQIHSGKLLDNWLQYSVRVFVCLCLCVNYDVYAMVCDEPLTLLPSFVCGAARRGGSRSTWPVPSSAACTAGSAQSSWSPRSTNHSQTSPRAALATSWLCLATRVQQWGVRALRWWLSNWFSPELLVTAWPFTPEIQSITESLSPHNAKQCQIWPSSFFSVQFNHW